MTADSGRPVGLVTGADRGLGLAFTAGLLQRGWRVFAGQYLPDWPELEGLESAYPDQLTLVPLDVSSTQSVGEAADQLAGQTEWVDMVISNAGVGSPSSRRDIRQGQDYDEMHRMYDTNALGPMRVVEALLPLMDKGSLRRLCFVSSEAGSIQRSARTAMFGYCASKSALNMYIKILFNSLRPDGYSFRVFHPGWLKSYMGGKRNEKADLEPEESAEPGLGQFLSDRDEDRLVMVDWSGNEWPW